MHVQRQYSAFPCSATSLLAGMMPLVFVSRRRSRPQRTSSRSIMLLHANLKLSAGYPSDTPTYFFSFFRTHTKTILLGKTKTRSKSLVEKEKSRVYLWVKPRQT